MSAFQGPTQLVMRPKPPATIEESSDCRRLWGSGQGGGSCPPGIWGGGRPPLRLPLSPGKAAWSYPGPTCALGHLGRMLCGNVVCCYYL